MNPGNIESAQIHYEQGLEYLKLGNLEGVLECFQQALILNPNFAEVHNVIGMIQFQIEKVATFVEWLQISSQNLNHSFQY